MKHIVSCMILGTLLVPILVDSTASTTGSTSTTASTSTTTKKTATSSVSPMSSTTLTPEQECAQHNNSCKDCVKNSKCLYCNSDDQCKLYPKGDILPKSSLCKLSDARWSVCWLNFEALIIACSVIGGVIVIGITCLCIYCCCCRNRSNKRYEREDSRYEQQKMERKVKQDERRTERKGKLDEIRRKYGLVKDDSPYQRFDA